jgi:hypothetical protein
LPPETRADTQQGPKWYRDEVKRYAKEREAFSRKEQLYQQQLQQLQAPQAMHPEDQGYDPYTFAQAEVARSEFNIKEQTSKMLFIEKHGEDVFEDVNAFLLTRPDIVDQCLEKQHPWSQAFKIYQKELASEEIGDDPAAYKERLRKEILAELQAGQQAQAPLGTSRGASVFIPPNSSAQRSANGGGAAAGGFKSLESIFGR